MVEILDEEGGLGGCAAAGQFVFLGARIYDYPKGGKARVAGEPSLGVLRDPNRVVLRDAAGSTLDPDGPGDSTPECLEP